MWSSKLRFSNPNSFCKVTIFKAEQPIDFAEAIAGWQNNPEFRQFYISLLANLPFEAIFWESPAITKSSLTRPYEFVALKSDRLAKVKPNPSAFKHHFEASAKNESVIAFENLGKDALLVVPCPQESPQIYPHLIKFLRESSSTQCHEFFRKLGEEVEKRLSDRPLWINTSGLGVYWLHARLDSYPKYYTFSPYKELAKKNGEIDQFPVNG